jgi:hypothetical protein
VAFIHALAIPESFWEYDETLFAQAIRTYDPWNHNPPPPGYPLFIGIGKLFNLVLGDPLVSLLAISYLATVIGFVALAKAFEAIAGDRLTGVLGALIFYLSPTMLIHGTVPQSDPLALCVFAFVLVSSAMVISGTSILRATLFGVLAGWSIGCRPQVSIIVVPLVLVTLLLARGRRSRVAIVAAFTVACLSWFIPLAVEVGGLERLYDYEFGQAAYYAAHDAAISRGGWGGLKIGGRFIARPWGPVWLAGIVLLFALAGFAHLLRRRWRTFAPLGIAAGCYLAFALATMDPADGARYALPSVVCVALLAAAGIVDTGHRLVGRRFPDPLAGEEHEGSAGSRRPTAAKIAILATALFAIASIAYTYPLIAQRSRVSSPPARAAEWVRGNVPRGAIILVELPLWPHARYWLRDYRIMKIDEGAPQLVRRGEVPVYLFADGASAEPDAVTFRWQKSHAYEKLTRNHYRVVSVVPWGPEDRFEGTRGVYGAERDADESWRWLAPVAELTLPDVDAERVVLELGLTRTSPIAENSVEVFANGARVGSVVVRRGATVQVAAPIRDGENRISIRAQRSFVPADAAGGTGDPRRLAVRLMDLDQLPAVDP